jgi:GH24 family phage-related lysozyme (muramidase)
MIQAGIDLVKSFEGCKLTAYKDMVGVWTIGWGTTSGVRPGMTISQARADMLLEHDLDGFEMDVVKLVNPKVQLNDFEKAALTSFAYNLGTGALARSTLLRYLNRGDRLHAANEFLKWNRAGGVPVSGLTRRRMAERDLFMRTA